LAAAYSALVYVKPTRIAISGGYHGVHASIEVYCKSNSVSIIDLDDEYRTGDVCWVETPLNPTGEARNIQHYADKIHAVGGRLLVDATFAPPPLQDPFKWGADIVMHSGTKYLGGHSDLLCGVLAVKSDEEWVALWNDRTYLGNTLGSLESYLLLRSLRTLHLRVPRQSETGTALAAWLKRVSQIPIGETWDGVKGGLIKQVWHAYFQQETWVKEQLEGGGPACFGFLMNEVDHARMLPHSMKFFTPATSLGGVESLLEYRFTSDPGADRRLIRCSVGVEDLEDLKADFRQGFKQAEKRAKGLKAKL